MVKLVASSVVRGAQQGQSHGGVFLIDFTTQEIDQVIDWNTSGIDWQGRGWDRGLRGIAFDRDRVFIAASDELFAYTSDFELIDSWRNPYLKHCHEIAVFNRSLFLTSTGYDSILAFDLDKPGFNWGMNIQSAGIKFNPVSFDPLSDNGPMMLNRLHINNVACNENGLYLSGLRTGGMLHFNGKVINMAVELPPGSHNAMPFRDGVLFNDTEQNVLRYAGRGEGEEDRAMAVPEFKISDLTHIEALDQQLARPGFARGLCLVSDTIVAGGASPSTVTLYDLAANKTLASVRLSSDVRNAIHGLEVWPYE
ncbi:MAG: hypothetical protein HOL98_03835 [Gammaproteobacteria bacterium]|jgi:hypothetical protein|nr:hypothetical protein [Gammaproteobacteria bacterium]MBT5202567.1 hypothetical protein [Gammaproteobacteria bacterium]MBT5603551.1 hypothetical protein [Gammaproteobacteria bacterium]MBT6244448.1 hypothetical protein [Gammaproteobacteria bacterium]